MKLAILLSLLFVLANIDVNAQDHNSTVLPICTNEDVAGQDRAFINRIINDPLNATLRASMGISNASVSDVTHLKEPGDNVTCTQLNNFQSAEYNEKNENNIRIHSVIHYKIQNRYLTLIRYNNKECISEDPDCNDLRSITLGVDIVEVRDLNLSKIGRWSF